MRRIYRARIDKYIGMGRDVMQLITLCEYEASIATSTYERDKHLIGVHVYSRRLASVIQEHIVALGQELA